MIYCHRMVYFSCLTGKLLGIIRCFTVLIAFCLSEALLPHTKPLPKTKWWSSTEPNFESEELDFSVASAVLSSCLRRRTANRL